MRGQRLAAFGLVLLFGFAASGAAVVYVDCNAPGPGHDGLTWDTAYLAIQEGVNLATPNGEVWVADGTYVENVVMGQGVGIYAGFLGAEPGGYETSLDQRDWANNVATIYGGWCCVFMAVDAVLDGFTLTGGDNGWLGGGVFCYEMGETGAIANNVITGNYADYGGGIGCYSSSPTIVNNVIADNRTLGYGGGIYCLESSPVVTGNTITGNRNYLYPGRGGGIYCERASPTVANNVVFGNYILGDGGGIWCSGASPTVANNVVFGNSAYGDGGGIWCQGSSPVLSHNDFWNNSPNNYYGCEPGEGDISADPLLGEGYHLLPESPCIDAGCNDYVFTDEDIDGDPRIIDGDGDGSAVVDIGVDEYAFFTLPAIAVDKNAPGPGHDGLTWRTAFLRIQEGVNRATPNGEVWVADGTYVENVVMGQGVQLYGGFLGAEAGGYETSLDQRDWVSNIAAIDGNRSGSCVVMAVDARVDGFTIANGTGTEEGEYVNGGGFLCEGLGETGVIAHNTITGNTAYGYCGYGGGVYCDGSSPTVTGNTISGNTAYGYGSYGGGIYCSNSSSPTVTGNTIAGNVAGGEYPSGGGIICGGWTVVTGNTIAGNAASGWDPSGGGIICGGCAVVTGNAITGNWTSHPELGWGGGIVCGDSTVVTGNAITGNGANFGGGMVCGGCAVVTGNTIAGNGVQYWGGGIYCSGGSPTVTNNTITGNGAGGWGARGGGIYCEASSPTVTGNTISGNSAGDGGGIVLCGCPSPTLTDNTITGNKASWWDGRGGGIYCEASSPTVTNNTISGNTAVLGRALACDSYQGQGPSDVEITNCILWNGGDEVWNNDGSTITITYSDVWGGWPGEGNIDADPLFLDPEKANWHLSFASPCIDAGTNYAPGLPETDWEGEPRVYDGDGDEEEPGVYATVDMGADEFVPLLAVAPDPQPECGGPLFGLPPSGYPGWVWFSIPIDPDSCCGYGDCYDPETLLGFSCSGRLWRWDKYGKYSEVYQLRFNRWDLAVGDSYLLRLWTEVSNPWYLGVSPYCPRTFEFKLGRMGWTWIGMPGLTELDGQSFMESVRVKYPSDEAGSYRTARQDYDAAPDSWITWGWAFYDTYLQAPKTFTPYAPFGNRTCYPWIGYRVWVNVGTAADEADPEQVTLIWPKVH